MVDTLALNNKGMLIQGSGTLRVVVAKHIVVCHRTAEGITIGVDVVVIHHLRKHQGITSLVVIATHSRAIDTGNKLKGLFWLFWDKGLCLKDLLHDTAICRTADKQHSKTHSTQIR